MCIVVHFVIDVHGCRNIATMRIQFMCSHELSECIYAMAMCPHLSALVKHILTHVLLELVPQCHGINDILPGQQPCKGGAQLIWHLQQNAIAHDVLVSLIGLQEPLSYGCLLEGVMHAAIVGVQVCK